MQVFTKVFFILLLIKNVKGDSGEKEKVNCNLNEVQLSGTMNSDFLSLFKVFITYLNSSSQVFEKQISTVKEDISFIKNSLQQGNYTITVKTKNETETKTPLGLYDNLWMIIQRRQDGFVDFYRNWYDYKQGFGNPFREFFIGLDKLHFLTSSAPHELLIRIEDFKGRIRYALYDHFLVGNETEKYQLKKLGNYSGNAGDHLRLHEGMYFSSKNVDNDASEALHCAKRFQGGWWYNNCTESNLNGPFRTRYVVSSANMTWGFKNDTQNKIVQMMLRLKP